jgi:hypothetical protein
MRIRSGSTTCSALVLGWEGHAVSSCFALMAAPGGRIRRRWLRARTVETVRGWRSNWEAGVASVASPSPPCSQLRWPDPTAVVGAAASAVWRRQEARSGWRRPDSTMVVAAHMVETVGGLTERLGGRGGLGSFPLPPPRSAGDRIPSRWSAQWHEVGRGGDSGSRGSLGGQVASAAPPTSSWW